MRFRIATIGIMLCGSPLLACPFCETGGRDAALFIVSVLIPFFLAGTFVLLAMVRLSKGKSSSDLSRRIFEAEGKNPFGDSDE
jgi:hypothetical protein